MSCELLGHALPDLDARPGDGPRWRVAVARPGGRGSRIAAVDAGNQLREAGCMVAELPVVATRLDDLETASPDGARRYDLVLALDGAHREAARLAVLLGTPLARLGPGTPGDLVTALRQAPLATTVLLWIGLGSPARALLALADVIVRPVPPGAVLQAVVGDRPPERLPSLRVAGPDPFGLRGDPVHPDLSDRVRLIWPDDTRRPLLAVEARELVTVSALDGGTVAVAVDGVDQDESTEVAIGPNALLRMTPRITGDRVGIGVEASGER